MSSPVFPTRHGDWHLIGGELVDLSQADTNSPPVRPGEARRAFGSSAGQWPAIAAPSPITGSNVDGEPSLSGPVKHTGRSEAARASGSQAPPPHPPLSPFSPPASKRRKSSSED